MPLLPRCSLKAAFAATLLCFATACQADAPPAEPAAPRPEVGLMGTIPIYWGEAGDLSEQLSGGGEPHWARAQIEGQFSLVPIDRLDAASMADLEFLLLAQPRALSPAENVALDSWVRAGGHLLLFADPMMTGESRYPIGDRRRPQDVILLSPILEHWELALEFDPDNEPGFVLVPMAGASIPVNLTGVFTLRDGEAECALLAEATLAECTLGEGRAVILADAALLDLHDPHPSAERALDWLLAESFASLGESAGDSSTGSEARQ